MIGSGNGLSPDLNGPSYIFNIIGLLTANIDYKWITEKQLWNDFKCVTWVSIYTLVIKWTVMRLC